MPNINFGAAITVAQKEAEALKVLQESVASAIQIHLDTAAAAKGYDSVLTAISYAEEPAVQKFQEDGLAFRAWRSLVWEYAYAQLALAESGKRGMPTVEEFLLELPPYGGATASKE